ncbi:MAG: hypothetical protein IKP23_06100 [Elusimicrobiaceae bacterium]|nr:hypothetical protein [Elusimicrobiaceae bacterium]
MKLKISAVILALVLVCGLAFAQNKNNAKTKTNAKVPVTVIAMTGTQFGGVDAGLNQGLENFFEASLDINVVDRQDALKDPKYQGFNLDYMPLYLVHRTKLVDEKFKEPIEKGYLRTTKDFVVLEKQTGNGVYANKQAKPNQLELFVMSQCPYGVMAENKIIEAKKAGLIPENVDIKVRFIVSPGRTADTFASLHGTAEWEEDVRQAIVQLKYPKKFWKYLEEFNKDYRTTRWDVVAEKAGLNPNIFRKYWKDGVKQLKEDMKVAQEYNVSGSPSLIWEGRVSTNMGSISTIPGFEGLNQAPAGNAAAQVPQGQC